MVNELAKIDSIWKLQEAILEMPQVDVITNHFWLNGMYIRQGHMPAGMLIVGKVHKQDHFIIVTKGSVQVSDEQGSRTVNQGEVIQAFKGTKRALLALEDSTWINIHRTNETDLDKLEEELVEEDVTSAYLPGNILKDAYITCS
jgi:hypothetical protein